MTSEITDALFLNRCKELAEMSDSRVYPNPRVGSVIVHEGKIIGEGFHRMPGSAHAEVAAVASVKDKSLLPSSTIYVNLEPCNHFGKTPPCTHLILEHKIPEVVIGSLDPNPQVAGSGVQRLKEHGLKVRVAEDPGEFHDLNKVFFTNQLKKRAFILLKWAESSDNFIATFNEEGKAIPTPISGSQSLRLAHKLRAKHHAIMIAKNTALIDNPRLNTRLYPGRTPIRIILDRNMELPRSLGIFQDGLETLILNEKENTSEGAVRWIKTDKLGDLNKLSGELLERLGICSVLVEGGSNLLQQYIDQAAYDEIWRVEAEKTLLQGISGPKIPAQINFEQGRLDRKDQLFYYRAYQDIFSPIAPNT
ncbi:MAG: bifunctional diaminohydroxyphosphoribosylaminopyrimidine deaminase/5-amino-6-(5-phosphoribosylamino)uracil reductase RibD [Bacteroidia bacterium]|nr:bifunctional diaminohydroxyphosphoribosylaminopyrimidine deaminase/5-amino-6-(5-phosphoribosylamino)uracil reductase RibD [Bacteroidia bacterium]